jgi:hypothetical protein
MGADVVVDVFPGEEEAVDFGDVGWEGVEHLVELLPVSSVGALDVGIEFGRARWQEIQRDSQPLTRLFELGLELAATIDLESPDGERAATQDGGQKELGGLGRGVPVGFQNVPTTHDITGGELTKAHLGDGAQIHGVELDQVAGSNRGRGPSGTTPRPGACRARAAALATA